MQNLLFVDDEKNCLKGMERMLRKQKDEWKFFFAQSVDQALDLTKAHPFDAIISDIKMPGKSGFDLLKALRKEDSTRTIQRIRLTTRSRRIWRRRARSLMCRTDPVG